MKNPLIVLIVILGHSLNGQSQKISNKNYYSFQKAGGSINWLRSCDAVPIIIDELLKKGIAYHTIGVGHLIKINDSTRFTVTVSFEKDEKKYGFLYEGTHGIPLNLLDRDFLTNRKKANYVEAEWDTSDNVNYMRIDPIPKNIFLLKETCYWFQYDTNGTEYLVSKEIAQSILRQDIDDYLKNL